MLIVILLNGCITNGIGANYEFRRYSRDYVGITGENDIFLIEGHIMNYNFDDKFIIVKQKPIKKICECNYNCFQKKYPNSHKDIDLCNMAFEKFSQFQYWIIDKRYSNVYGGFSKKQYLMEREALGVSKSLTLTKNR